MHVVSLLPEENHIRAEHKEHENVLTLMVEQLAGERDLMRGVQCGVYLMLCGELLIIQRVK